ncbi:MAG: hypothetical protein HDS13_06990 [Bacteroides sp.]|nr:hypothetical protein [Bacteroides sp.]
MWSRSATWLTGPTSFKWGKEDEKITVCTYNLMKRQRDGGHRRRTCHHTRISGAR